MSPLPRQGWLFLIEFLKWYFSKYWQVRTRPVFAQTVTNNANQDKKRWPCPNCGAKNYYPENCPRLAFSDSSLHPKPSNLRVSRAPMCGDFNNEHCTRKACTVLSNTFACHARAPTPESPVQTKQTEDRPTGTSDTGSMPQQSLTIEHNQVYHRPSLSSKHTLRRPVHHYFQYSTFIPVA